MITEGEAEKVKAEADAYRTNELASYRSEMSKWMISDGINQDRLVRPKVGVL